MSVADFENFEDQDDHESAQGSLTSNIREVVKDKQRAVLLRTQSGTFIKSRDKFTFLTGVVNVIWTPYLLGTHPEYFPAWYTFKAITLITLRWFLYYSQNWHYFLLDFCYFANMLCLVYLHVYPSETLFIVCWCSAFGPLSWAIIAWKNSMVFHSLDKITSLFIHLCPPLLMFGLRYKWHGDLPIPDPATLTIWDMYLTYIPVYLIWQFLYWLKVYVVSKQKTDRVTSARWLLGSKKGLIYKLAVLPFGETYADYGFMLTQLFYTLLVLVPVWAFYQSEVIAFIFIIGVGTASIWNGASYYFEVFSSKYMLQLQEADKKLAERQGKETSANKSRFDVV